MRNWLVVAVSTTLWTSTARADDEADCAKKKGKACLAIGQRYLNGDGVDKDPVKALAYYQKACTAKIAEGCGFAGTLLVKGDLVPKDEAAGFVLRDKACKGKHASSCNDLGTSWSDGNEGAPAVDHKKAKALYEQACKLSDGLGCFNLGNVYRLGEGTKADAKQSVTFFTKSCDLDTAKGCTELGILLYEGKAVPQDKAKATELFDRACKLGSEVACKNHKAVTAAAKK